MPAKAKLFIGSMVALGGCFWIYGILAPVSKNPSEFICYLLIALLASRLKVKLPGITGTMSVNFLFILLGLLELSFPETLVLGASSILVQCIYRDRPSTVQVTFNLCANAVSIMLAYGVYHHPPFALILASRPLLLAVAASTYFDRGGDRIDGTQVVPADLGRVLFLVLPLLPGGSGRRRHHRLVRYRLQLGDLAAHLPRHLPDLPFLPPVFG